MFFLNKKKVPMGPVGPIEIEPHIKPLVDAMNEIETVETIASCQGHFFRGRPPYIYFSADILVASKIERAIREHIIATGLSDLNESWCVQGVFDGSYELKFTLYSHIYHLFVGQKCNLKFIRSRLDADFVTLKNLIEHVNEPKGNPCAITPNKQ